MLSVVIDDRNLPRVIDLDYISASEGFFHVNRTAKFHVLIYVTEGCMYVTEGDTDYEIKAGQLLILKSGVRHFGKYETRRGTCWFYAHFILPEMPEGRKLVVPKYCTGLSESELEKSLEYLPDLFHGTKPEKGHRVNALFYEILLKICEAGQPGEERRTDKICRFLKEISDRDFSREQIAEKFFLSYSHLAAEFKRETGMSMGKYHALERMQRAERLLRSTPLPVGEVADLLGFSDRLYFTKKFRAYSGRTPSEYRRYVQRRYANLP